MKRLSSSILVMALALPWAAFATDAVWINNGTIVQAPNIDATTVINNGTMSLNTSQPFDTSNTRNVTNNGTMRGSVGWRFDDAPRNSSGQATGARKLAENFHNRASGTVAAEDGFQPTGASGSYLQVSATNIINQGLLSTGPGGLLQITGTNVNLSRSGLGVGDFAGFGRGSVNGETNFLPDTAIYDNYWGQTNATFNTGGIINYFGSVLYAISPVHGVSTGGPLLQTQIGAFGPVSAAYTNVGGGITLTLTNMTGDVTNMFFPTNISRQAVFVAPPNTANFSIGIRFYPSSIATNPMQTVAIEMAATQTNVVVAADQINTIYYVDTLASETNRGTLLNVIDGTRKPANYLVSRVPVFEYFFGTPGNGAVTNDFLWGPDFGDPVVTGEYAGYSAFIDNLAFRPPGIPSGTVTNLPGRLEINAENLDLTKARLGTEGYLSIKTRNLVSSSNTVVDCENLSFDLSTTNGLLQIQNLTKATVQRMRGDIYAWSGLWTNSINQVITNYDVSTNPVVEILITNNIALNLHALILDASSLQTTIPVSVFNLNAKATNVVMRDNANVVDKFLVDGQSFTLTGRLNMLGNTPSWVQGTAPLLKYFTNSGVLNINNEGHFGDDRPSPYLAFVNRGSISSQGQNISSDYVELAGTNLVGASFVLNAQDATVSSGRINSQSDAILTANTLKLDRALIQCNTRLTLNVNTALFDNGSQSSNSVSVQDGFDLSQKPASGDLLGTTFQSVAPNFASVDHVWAGEDRGASPAGYSNNVALGKLVLVQGGFDPYFIFGGAGSANGLYVDLLDLSLLSDYANQIQIDPSLTIYYAAAKLSAPAPGGLTSEEYLNGQFGGRLRWVPGFAGPNSSVDVVINGNQTIQINKALRNSTTIDSDSDGLPNYYDLSPFDGVTISSISYITNPPGYQLTWTGAPYTAYVVEYRSSATTGTWNVLTTTNNPAATSMPLTVEDTNLVPVNEQRYYRVIYNPNGP
jgi:hypothetical protein